MLARLNALWLLGTSFAATLLRVYLGLGRRRGLKLFADNYRADGLVPVSGEQREVQQLAQRCFACGRCTAGDARLTALAKGRYPGLMTLVLAGARGTPDFAAARTAWDCIDDAELARRELLCPVDVPLRRLKRYVLARSGA